MRELNLSVLLPLNFDVYLLRDRLIVGKKETDHSIKNYVSENVKIEILNFTFCQFTYHYLKKINIKNTMIYKFSHPMLSVKSKSKSLLNVKESENTCPLQPFSTKK